LDIQNELSETVTKSYYIATQNRSLYTVFSVELNCAYPWPHRFKSQSVAALSTLPAIKKCMLFSLQAFKKDYIGAFSTMDYDFNFMLYESNTFYLFQAVQEYNRCYGRILRYSKWKEMVHSGSKTYSADNIPTSTKPRHRNSMIVNRNEN